MQKTDFARLATHMPLDSEMIIDSMPSASWFDDEAFQALYDERIEENDEITDYGEGFMGVAAHADDMTGLDRMLFEDCNQGSGRLQRPGYNVPTVANRERIESLARRLECTIDEAVDLVDFWKITDETGRLWSVFERWAKVKGVTAALNYFETLAGELVLVVDERSLDPFSIEGDTLTLDFDSEQVIEDTPISELTILEIAFDRIGWTDETGTFHIDKGFTTPAEFKYQNLEDDPNAPEPMDAETVCPNMTRFLTLKIEATKAKLNDLAKLRKAAATGAAFTWMNKPQRREWWAVANERFTECLELREQYRAKIRNNLTAREAELLKQIDAVKSKKQAGFFWATLYQAKDGRIPGVRQAVAEHFLMDRLDASSKNLN